MTVCLRVRRLALGALGVQSCLEGAELGGELLVLTLEGLEVEEGGGGGEGVAVVKVEVAAVAAAVAVAVAVAVAAAARHLEVEEELGALGAQFLGVRLAGGVFGLELRELRAEAIPLEPRLLQRCLQRGWWRR